MADEVLFEALCIWCGMPHEQKPDSYGYVRSAEGSLCPMAVGRRYFSVARARALVLQTRQLTDAEVRYEPVNA